MKYFTLIILFPQLFRSAIENTGIPELTVSYIGFPILPGLEHILYHYENAVDEESFSVILRPQCCMRLLKEYESFFSCFRSSSPKNGGVYSKKEALKRENLSEKNFTAALKLKSKLAELFKITKDVLESCELADSHAKDRELKNLEAYYKFAESLLEKTIEFWSFRQAAMSSHLNFMFWLSEDFGTVEFFKEFIPFLKKRRDDSKFKQSVKTEASGEELKCEAAIESSKPELETVEVMRSYKSELQFKTTIQSPRVEFNPEISVESTRVEVKTEITKINDRGLKKTSLTLKSCRFLQKMITNGTRSEDVEVNQLLGIYGEVQLKGYKRLEIE